VKDQEHRAVQDRPGHALSNAAEVFGRVGAGVVSRNVDEEVERHAQQELDQQPEDHHPGEATKGGVHAGMLLGQ
jgi:hypothetical protein